ncbi:GtrA family protein [Halochromatium roseum]|uniref:GtrA family protein n=1 Tax=Halochromatium roseum TaxID=391920 RepID=UPI00191371CA|nr:GtrA family protein [Halochromatium roseum]MBK5940706.1 hypothetical protein [Halochromatium roseum]
MSMRAHQDQGETKRQVIRFAVVGCINVLVSLLVFQVCYSAVQLGAGLDLWVDGIALRLDLESINGALSNALGYSAGMVSSFLLNKRWTFRASGPLGRQLQRFLFLNLVGLALSSLSLLLFVDLLQGPHLAIWGITTLAVVLLNFYGNKLWTFRAQRPVMSHERA